MQAKKFELFMGCLGNGTTVCNKAVYQHGDYKKVAHISEHGVIELYVESDYIPLEEMQKIQAVADADKVKFLKWWNLKDDLQKFRYMLELPTIGCGITRLDIIENENKRLPLAEKVALMEKAFFEMSM